MCGPDAAVRRTDYETDTVIQASLRKELDKGVTVLTIAHRLQTIMDADKIVGGASFSLFLMLSSTTVDGPRCWTHREFLPTRCSRCTRLIIYTGRVWKA